MDGTMNYIIAVVLSLISGLPFLFMEETSILYLFYLALIIVYFLLTFWNGLGDFIVTRFVLRGEEIGSSAEIFPIIQDFYKRNKREIGNPCKIYFTQSWVPYFILIGETKVIVSYGTQEYIHQYGIDILINGVPKETFTRGYQCSQKIVLLALTAVPIARWILAGITWIFIKFTEIIFGIATMIATGAFFGSLDDMVNSYSWGKVLAWVATKINDGLSFVQDKIIELIINFTQRKSFQYVEQQNRIK